MSAVEAKRTLVKSPPEVWAKVSDPEVLADHLADLGPIQITRVEPESVVLWEGDLASGAVHLEAGGWGTKVRLVAELVEPEVVAPPAEEAVMEAAEPEPAEETAPCDELGAMRTERHTNEPEPAATADPAPLIAQPEPKRGIFARWFRRKRTAAVEAEPEGEWLPVEEEPETPPLDVLLPEAESPPEPPPAPEPEPDEPAPGEHPPPHHEPTAHLDAQQALAVLETALDRLGAAHHRPFSRA